MTPEKKSYQSPQIRGPFSRDAYLFWYFGGQFDRSPNPQALLDLHRPILNLLRRDQPHTFDLQIESRFGAIVSPRLHYHLPNPNNQEYFRRTLHQQASYTLARQMPSTIKTYLGHLSTPVQEQTVQAISNVFDQRVAVVIPKRRIVDVNAVRGFVLRLPKWVNTLTSELKYPHPEPQRATNYQPDLRPDALIGGLFASCLKQPEISQLVAYLAQLQQHQFDTSRILTQLDTIQYPPLQAVLFPTHRR